MRDTRWRPRATLAAAVLATLVAGIAVTARGRAASDPPDARRSVRYATRTMGTYAQIVLVTADSAAGALRVRGAQRALARVDSLMSNWTTTSEVARLNRIAADGPTPVQYEVAVVLDAALRLWRETSGAFDITVEPLVRLWGFIGGPRRVPEPAEIQAALAHVGGDKLDFDSKARTLRFAEPGVRIDLGGIAKGYAVDVAADSLRVLGVTDALVDLSGNMVALGHPAGTDAWRIGIRDPRDRITHFARLRITGEAISSSGQYEQFVASNGRTYGHILDPRTGWPANGLTSVTVVAATALECDAWDTPLFVMGPEAARRKAKQRSDIGVVLVTPGGANPDTAWVEESLRDRFTLDAAAGPFMVVRFF